ncbi:aldo/keto reductase [Streptococcus merionis]|uniref:aldo/keto reductase n=1 Tax=Streptococcus merionis TaxID=400065 RepID=UPI0026ECDD5B|nr:aldo/keto reductase [Streptococcus merionis]
MKYITAKGVNGDFQVSRIAFGTGSALKNLTKAEFFELFDLFVSKGGNVLDTAPGYNRGRSEQYIGEWMKSRDNREDVIVSTKACHTFEGEPSRLTLKDMLEDLATSLSQLQTDYIDLFWIHNDDPNKPVSQIIDDVNEVIKTGKVRAVGCSNWSIERIAAANQYAKENGLYGFWANQIQWSLARVETDDYIKAFNALVMDDKNYNWYVNNDVAVFAFSSVAQGFFSIAVKDGLDALPENTKKFFATPSNIKRLENVKAYMAEHNVPASVPVIGYITNNRLSGVALTSATTTAILSETLEAADATLTNEEIDALFNVN